MKRIGPDGQVFVVSPPRRPPKPPFGSGRLPTWLFNTNPGFVSFNWTQANGDNVRYDYDGPTEFGPAAVVATVCDPASGNFINGYTGGVFFNGFVRSHCFNKHKY